ncbi:S-adenosyl-l-methionine decarboxylase leader peptide [Dillenia turbinata]|uniref:S-adenosyl-l-methionine decarboxylase leader peptide n=1 Tax=Dillenia turbinata TaxID=194707 RepID=A0AAN8YUE6_9MAGN
MINWSSLLRLNDLMEAKGGKKKSSSKSLFYEAPLGYSIEDVRPNGGIKKFRSAAYSNCARKPS